MDDIRLGVIGGGAIGERWLHDFSDIQGEGSGVDCW